jgi:nucleoside-diphosphate-sugar epimerase
MYHLPEVARPRFLEDASLRQHYRGKRALVLGGDGFIGSYVATALQVLGAEVSILSRRYSSLLENTGIKVFHGHLMQRETLEAALANQELVFDLAGSSGGVISNRDARRNLVTECEPHLNVFQIAAEMLNPPLVVFCSSRTVYGKPETLPVSENHRVSPESVYAIHKLTLENYLQSFHHTHGLNYLIFRLSNPYGACLCQQKKDYGVINQFIRSAFLQEPIRLFGEGAQSRDYIFIDDVVEAFLRAASKTECHQQVFNLGGPAPISMKDAVRTLTAQRPGSEVSFVPWPADYRAIETGDYVTDLRKLKSYLPEWHPTSFEAGVRRTFNVYDQLLTNDRTIRTTGKSLPSPETPARSAAPRLSFWDKRRVLVTGASGFVGGHLVARMVELGATVAAIHRKPLAPALASHPQVLSLQFDLEDTERLDREMDAFQPEVIFHLASRPDGPEVENHAAACINANLLVTVHLLEIARRLSVSAFVFADSTKVYGNSPVPHREDSATNPCSSYAASKLAAWNHCRIFAKLHGLPVVALRPTLIYGPGQGKNLFTFLAQSLASDRPEIVLDGGFQTRDPLYIDDAVCAYVRAAEAAEQLSGRAIPIGGGNERTVEELANSFIQAAGGSTPVRCCGDRVRATETMRSYCDNVDAWEALRWRPEVGLMEGLRSTAHFLLGEDVSSIKPNVQLAAA